MYARDPKRGGEDIRRIAVMVLICKRKNLWQPHTAGIISLSRRATASTLIRANLHVESGLLYFISRGSMREDKRTLKIAAFVWTRAISKRRYVCNNVHCLLVTRKYNFEHRLFVFDNVITKKKYLVFILYTANNASRVIQKPFSYRI